MVGLALVAVTAAIFWPVGSYDFIVYDDGGYAKNPHVISGLSLRNIAWAFQTTEMANWHPLTWLSYMLDCQLFGVRAGRSAGGGTRALRQVMKERARFAIRKARAERSSESGSGQSRPVTRPQHTRKFRL